VAALAAALVEYQRSVDQRDEYAARGSAQSNWRMAARMSRLHRLQ